MAAPPPAWNTTPSTSGRSHRDATSKPSCWLPRPTRPSPDSTTPPNSVDAGKLDIRGRHVNTGGYPVLRGDEIGHHRNHRQLHTDQGLTIPTATNRPSTTSTATATSPVAELAPSASPPTTCRPTSSWPTPRPATPPRPHRRPIVPVLDGPTDVRGVYVPMTRGTPPLHRPPPAKTPPRRRQHDQS